jgi:hypothetical protein
MSGYGELPGPGSLCPAAVLRWSNRGWAHPDFDCQDRGEQHCWHHVRENDIDMVCCECGAANREETPDERAARGRAYKLGKRKRGIPKPQVKARRAG